MRAITHVFCDESGNTGQNLADLSQPVFTLASTTIDQNEATRLLAPFAVLNQNEVKYTKVRKTSKGQRLVLDFLNDPAVVGQSAKIYVVHKPFMIVSKIVDMIYEPQLHAVGENFYANKAALATANLIATVYPVFGGRTRFYRLLELFVKAVRKKDDDSIARFFRDANAFKDHVEDEHGEDNAAQLLPILLEERTGAPNLRRGSTDELDPIVPSFKVHAAHWSRESNQRFAIVSDDSSTLERNQQVFLDYSNPLGTPVSVDYYGEKIEYPLKIDRFEFVDSQTQPSIRIVDLLAGIASDAFTPMVNLEKPTPYQKAITQPLLDHGLILNAIWPGTDVTPESLNAGTRDSGQPGASGRRFPHLSSRSYRSEFEYKRRLRMAKKVHSVNIGATTVDEKARVADLERLRADIERWANQRELWLDCAFHTPFIYRDERPASSEVLLLTTEGPLAGAIGITSTGLGNVEPQFTELLARHGFIFEAENHYTISLYPEDQKLLEEYRALDRWRWIQRLANERLFEIHTEVFEHFANRPDDIRKLAWRQFEELLDAVFKNQGFVTELGPGGNDGGVDLRLYQSGAVPELVALVQAKRYTDRPVTRDPVAALFGVAALEGAPKGIVATTSRFLPSAKAFAQSVSQHINLPKIELVDSLRVSGWCAEVAQHLNHFFSGGSAAAPLTISRQAATKLTGKIVVATGGYNMTSNFFAVIEADFPHEVILRPIGSQSDTPQSQTGHEVPDITAPATWIREARFTAFKRPSQFSKEPQFRGDRKLFSLWNGKPMPYNYCD